MRQLFQFPDPGIPIPVYLVLFSETIIVFNPILFVFLGK